MRLNDRCGAILLEALVALAVLGIVGASAAETASESMRMVARVHEAEARLCAASRFLTAVSLWRREDLDRHLGSSTQGQWQLRVDRPSATLYDVSLRETATGALLLQTGLFRGETDR